MDHKYWKDGDYVKVTQLPVSIGLFDENLEQRVTLIGHIGIIISINLETDHDLKTTTKSVEVGFHGGDGWDTIERVFQVDELTFVCRPIKKFDMWYQYNC